MLKGTPGLAVSNYFCTETVWHTLLEFLRELKETVMVPWQSCLKHVPLKEGKQHIKKKTNLFSSLSVLDVKKCAIPKAQIDRRYLVLDLVTCSLLQFHTWKHHAVFCSESRRWMNINFATFLCKKTHIYMNICISIRDNRINLKSCDKCLYVKI